MRHQLRLDPATVGLERDAAIAPILTNSRKNRRDDFRIFALRHVLYRSNSHTPATRRSCGLQASSRIAILPILTILEILEILNFVCFTSSHSYSQIGGG